MSVTTGAEPQEVSITPATPERRDLPPAPAPCLHALQTLADTTLTACPSEAGLFENSCWGLSLPRVAPRLSR